MAKRNHESNNASTSRRTMMIEEARAAAIQTADTFHHLSHEHYRRFHRNYHCSTQQKLSYQRSTYDSAGSYQSVSDCGSRRAIIMTSSNQCENTQEGIHHDREADSKLKNRKVTKKMMTKKDYSSFHSDNSSKVLSKSRKVTKNAFMCAYCGDIFSKESYANHHEWNCIKNGLIKSMIFSCSDNTVNQGNSNYYAVPMQGHIKLSRAIKKCIAITDEALIKVLQRSRKIVLSKQQIHAQRTLALMARNRSFYDMRNIRSLEMKKAINLKKRSREGVNIWHKLQNKLSDAYVLIKEGDDDNNHRVDKYKMKRSDGELKHDDNTIYINVIVKHSTQLLHNELERQAQQRWTSKEDEKENKNNFELLRSFAHVQALRFAKFTLSADVKPKKIAVQLSNDLCSLLSPQLQLCGVEVETNIEYRHDEFFILGVNIISIDWIIMMKHFNKKFFQRKNAWRSGSIRSEKQSWKFVAINLFRMTRLEFVEQLLAGLHRVNWIISVPLCILLYKCFIKSSIQRLIVTSVTDDFFNYVEHKGMEIDLQVKYAFQQAAFMFDVLNQMIKDQHDLNKKKNEATEGVSSDLSRGPLLGPLVDIDKTEVGSTTDFSEPENLEFVVFDSDLPVGYRRLRKALLFNTTFMEEALFIDALGYTNISSEPWDKYDGEIGKVDNDLSQFKEFIGAKKNAQYLMPKSAFVKANMAYETTELIAYNDNFFSIKRKTTNPDVPYGRTFYALTQITVRNVGRNNCRMVCSVEAEFPNGPPMIARSIKSAMRQGVSDMFLELGESICKYSSIVK